MIAAPYLKVMKPGVFVAIAVLAGSHAIAETNDRSNDERVKSGDPIAKLITGSLGKKAYAVSKTEKNAREASLLRALMFLSFRETSTGKR